MPEIRTDQRTPGFKWLSLYPLLMGLLGLVSIFSVIQFRVGAQDEAINGLESRADINHTAITTLQGNVTEVRNDVSDIKDDVRDIQTEQIAQGKLLERILEKLDERPKPSR